VPCERVFSSSKLTDAPQRHCMSGELMEALQMLKYSIVSDLNFMEEWANIPEDTADNDNSDL
ncbi:hypothetical protein BC835DRAFT_1212495, partial [Cytidiella melzeri]